VPCVCGHSEFVATLHSSASVAHGTGARYSVPQHPGRAGLVKRRLPVNPQCAGYVFLTRNAAISLLDRLAHPVRKIVKETVVLL